MIDTNDEFSEFNQPHDISQSTAPASLDLQEDKDDALQEDHAGDTPSEILNIPEDKVKEGFDQIAFDESARGTDGAENTEQTDDWREHVEDMDENDGE